MTTSTTPVQTFLDRVASRARDAGVFGTVMVEAGMVVAPARASAEAAFYRVEIVGDDVWVSLVMKDRWLSESIEAQLMHTGDKLEELLDEELADLGYNGEPMGFEHFRSDEMDFTFRSKTGVASSDLGSDDAAADAARCLLAYELTFRQLGDMEADGDD